MDMLRFSMASASGWEYFGRKFRTNMLKFSLSRRCDSVAIVSNTIDDLPEPDTPVKMVILRLGIRRETFLRLFSRAPRISIYSWDTFSPFNIIRGMASGPGGVLLHRPTVAVGIAEEDKRIPVSAA